MKILINNQEQDNIKAIQVGDYWVVVDLKTKGKNNGDGYYYDEFEFACPVITKCYESDKIELTEYKIIASTKFIDKSIPVIKFVEQSVEELARQSTLHIPCNQDDRELENCRNFFIEGYNQAKSSDKKWSDEDMLDFANWCRIYDNSNKNEVNTIQQLFTKYQSLNQSQLPDVINLEMEVVCDQCLDDKTADTCYCHFGKYKTINKLKTTSTPEGEVIIVNI